MGESRRFTLPVSGILKQNGSHRIPQLIGGILKYSLESTVNINSAVYQKTAAFNTAGLPGKSEFGFRRRLTELGGKVSRKTGKISSILTKFSLSRKGKF